MNILLLPSLYYPNIGGIEDFSNDLAKNLISQGHNVKILTKKWPENLLNYESIEGIEVFRIPSAKTKKDYSELDNWIEKNIDKLKVDIIHVIGVRRCLPLAGLKIAKLLNIPTVLTVAGGEIPQKGEPLSTSIWERDRKIIEYAIKNADTVTCFSEGLKKNILKVLPGTKLIVLHAGVHLNVFEGEKYYRHKNEYIFCARRLYYDKGVDVLIHAFGLLSSKFDIDLIIAGDGPELKNLKLQVKNLKLNKKVLFVGTISQKKLVGLLRSAKFTVVPSRCEGGGLINIEAQAAGCPVIASNIGGIPEYVKDGYSGFLVPPNNPQILSNTMNIVLQDQKLLNTLRENGKVFSLNFDWKLLIHKYIALYKKTILK